MTGLSFKSLLMSISDQLTGKDLDRMKFGIDLPQGKLEDVQEPFELFREMMNAKLLSEENRDHLAALLQFAGRIDLSNKLLQDLQLQSTTDQGKLQGAKFAATNYSKSNILHKSYVREWHSIS